jgi:undecaprenyl diphosphate synthase
MRPCPSRPSGGADADPADAGEWHRENPLVWGKNAGSVHAVSAPTASGPARRDEHAVPAHVAIIMDGNGRWAIERGLPRLEGHRAGAKTVREIVTHAREIGVRFLTLYAFSSENWGRPEPEVGGLMQLLFDYLVEEQPTMLKNGIELNTIGDTDALPSFVSRMLDDVKEQTRGQGGMRLTLALSYGGRDELMRAVRGICADVQSGAVRADQVNEALLSSRLDTRDMPDPDLLIRTSGEMRVSNFLLWQIAYSELYITDTPWPSFTRADFDTALETFRRRQRRFGLTGAQIAGATPEARTDEEAGPSQ